jgi:hypothetical protein
MNSLSQAQYSGSNAKLVWWPKISMRRCFITAVDGREGSRSQKPAPPKTENDPDLELHRSVQ